MNLVLSVLFLVSSLLGYNLGAKAAPLVGQALPSATAAFETSLQSAITSSATTMTLTANAVRGGGALSGYNCFTIDEGSAQAETVCGTVSGTTVSSLTRGISQSTGTTTVSALQFAHRRGANVKITDFPLIQILKAQANGEDTYPNLLTYTSGTACSGSSANGTICDKAYIDGVSVAGASNANATTKGIVELATQTEMGSSTSIGSTGASLVNQTQYSTSSPSVVCGVCSVATASDGKIRQTFLDLTIPWTFTSAVTIPASNLTTNTLTLNSLPYKFPATRGASSTVLAENGSGSLSWIQPTITLYNAAPNLSSSAAATTTLVSVTIPANALKPNNSLRIAMTGQGTGGCTMDVEYGNGSATTTLAFSAPSNGSFGNMLSPATLNSMTYSTSTNTQFTSGMGMAWNATTFAQVSGGYSAVTTASQSYIGLAVKPGNGQACTLIGATVELLTQ